MLLVTERPAGAFLYHTMLARIVVAAVLAITTVPAGKPAVSPSPQPSATPALKTIASVRANSRCAAIITHANSAIVTALDNDSLIGQTITMLRITDLDDGNAIHRRNGLNSLGDLAKKLMQQSRAGDDEVKRLRKLAAESKDPQEAKELKQFADQLGGALWRQQKIARDLNGYLAYEDFRDMSKVDESQGQINQAVFGVRDPEQERPTVLPGPQGPVYGSGPNAGQPAPSLPEHIGHEAYQPTSNQYAQAAAKDFQQRIPDIIIDENHAATHVDGALVGCEQP